MRFIHRTTDGSLLRDVLPLAGGMVFIGASFGAIAVASGMQWWMPSVMSVFVFAGGSQFLAVEIIASGGGAVAAVLGGLVLNARHLPFGFAVGDVFGKSWPGRLLGAHLLVDETTAFALGQTNARRAKHAYWLAGVSLFIAWNLGTVIGVIAGQAIGDPDAFGLDAAFPAALLALTLPSLKDKPTLRAALVGAVIAVATSPYLPAGIPVLLALLGMLVSAKQPETEGTQ